MAEIRWDMLANLGGNFVDAYDKARQRRTLSGVGEMLTSGNPDYGKAAALAFEGGRGDLGVQLLTLGETHRQRQLQEKASADFSGAVGGVFGGGSNAAPSNPAAPDQPQAFDPRSVPSFVAAAGERYGISPEFMNRTTWIESRGNPRAVSPTGAKGLMQFTGGTARQYGLADPFDARANADAGARLEQFRLRRTRSLSW